MPGAFLATNLITASATITPSSEDSVYPAEYLYDRQAARVFRSTSLTTLSILIDFGAAVQADTIAIVNHNLTAAATLSLKAGATSPPADAVATPVYRANDIWKAFTATAARYWLLEITDTNTAVLEIGQLLLGVRTVLPRARRIGSGYKPARRRGTISGETYAGVFHNYHLYERLELNPSFRIGSAAELAILQALDAAVYGKNYPFLYVPDATGADCYYVRKEEHFEPEEFGRIAGRELVHDYQMTLIEESRGLEIQS